MNENDPLAVGRIDHTNWTPFDLELTPDQERICRKYIEVLSPTKMTLDDLSHTPEIRRIIRELYDDDSDPRARAFLDTCFDLRKSNVSGKDGRKKTYGFPCIQKIRSRNKRLGS